MNYWYVARPNELFLDIDNVSRSIKHVRARLQGAIECGKLDVAYVMQRPSRGNDHIHVIVTLKEHIAAFERYVWEIILHSDLYRGCCNIMRELQVHYTEGGLETLAPDILISPFDHFEAVVKSGNMNIVPRREPDDICNCETKHNAATMQDCPAAIRLRGEFRNVGFFGKPSKNPCTIWPDAL